MRRRLILALGILLFAGLCLAQVFVLQRRPSAAAAQAFSPSDIGNLYVWYQASAISSNVGANIGTWVDSAPLGYNLIQTSTGARPKLTNYAGALNNSNWVHFDGDDTMLTASVSNVIPITIFALVNLLNTNANKYVMDGTNASGRLVLYSPNNGKITASQNGAASLLGPVDTVRSNVWCLLEFVLNGASSFILTNGVVCTNGNITAGTNTGITLGGSYTLSSRWIGGIAEYIYYSTNTLSDANRLLIRQYFTNKYAL